MRKIILLVMSFTAMLSLGSCSASKKAALSKNQIETVIAPGAELVSGKGLIRGWGMGKSDSEASAHRKAQMNASAALAMSLTQMIESTTEEYITILSSGNNAESKTVLNDHVKTSMKQSLSGATIIYDRWAKKSQDGQYVNYIVMELKGEDFLQKLYSELEKDNTQIDKELLQKLFLKHIDSGN